MIEKFRSITKTNGIISYASSTAANLNLMPMTIRDRLEFMAERMPDAVAYVFPHNADLRLTFRDCRERALLMAHNLLRMGFKKGDRLALALPNTYELIVAYFAAAYVGVIVVTLNPEYGLDELKYMLDKTTPAGLVVYDYLDYHRIIDVLLPDIADCEKGRLTLAKCPYLAHVVLVSVNKNLEYRGAWSYEEVAFKRLPTSARFGPEDQDVEFPYVDIDDPFGIIFTSGTTDRPKGCVIKQSSMLNNSYVFAECVEDEPRWALNCCNAYLMFYAGCISMSIMGALVSGKQVVFPSYKQDLVDILRAVERYQCNTLIGMPKLLNDLLDNPLCKQFNLTSLEYVGSASQLVSPTLIRRLKTELNLKNIVVRFAMTETGLISMSKLGGEESTAELGIGGSGGVGRGRAAIESVGRPIPFFEAKIVDPVTSAILPLGREGELLVKGFSTTPGYWGEPDKTRQLYDENGWLKTGDMMSMDASGALYFHSRLKEVIVKEGRYVFPSEVEKCLIRHDLVSEVVAFGVTTELLCASAAPPQHKVCAWVRLGGAARDESSAPQLQTIADQIRAFCVGRLEDHQIPDFIKFVSAYPIKRGKYLRNEMQTVFRHEYLKQSSSPQRYF